VTAVGLATARTRPPPRGSSSRRLGGSTRRLPWLLPLSPVRVCRVRGWMAARPLSRGDHKNIQWAARTALGVLG
jgi:hypothetical protein